MFKIYLFKKYAVRVDQYNAGVEIDASEVWQKSKMGKIKENNSD